jgi:hypothetical protein
VSGRSLRARAAGRHNAGRPSPGRRYALVWWYGMMGLVGFGFGSLADRRPFGQDIFVHPLVMFFILVGLALIALRVLLARPVPEVISDRALLVGCFIGLAMFLAGNFVSTLILPPA